MTHKTTTFRQNSTSFISIGYTSRVIHSFLRFSNILMPFFAERLIFGLKIRFSSDNHFFIWSQIFYPIAFFLGLQTRISRWEPDSKNTVDGEAIQNAIRAILHCRDRLVTRWIALVKEVFFLLHLGSLFRNFFLQMHQKRYIIFAIDGSSFFKVLDE